MKRLFLSFAFLLAVAPMARAQNKPEAGTSGQATPASAGPMSIAAKTAGMERLPGYVPLYWDAKTGKMWLEAGDWGT
ncbi:MAG TPA: hypothetical protein VJX29_04035, partial [Candidatus Acidoferrales bacterium]|nr:hypothetical protein [Candidatus Acidoferrales bacterium]